MEKSILLGEYRPKSNDCLVITIMLATTLFLVQGDQALPSSFIVGVDPSGSKISVLCVLVLIQSIASEAEEDVPMKKTNELAMFHTGTGIAIRVVIVRLVIDKLLGFFSSNLEIFRFQSCSHSFQRRFARHYSRVQRQRGETVVVEQSGGRLARDTSLLIVIEDDLLAGNGLAMGGLLA
jgi:hypothetical protein